MHFQDFLLSLQRVLLSVSETLLSVQVYHQLPYLPMIDRSLYGCCCGQSSVLTAEQVFHSDSSGSLYVEHQRCYGYDRCDGNGHEIHPHNGCDGANGSYPHHDGGGTHHGHGGGERGISLHQYVCGDGFSLHCGYGESGDLIHGVSSL